MVNINAQMYLSDGTPVEFVKTTNKGNVQVRLPAQDAEGAGDPLRIFNIATGRHYKNGMSRTLTNTKKVNAALPMELSDGTPVNLVEITSKGNIKVRLPATHPLARTDSVRIFTPAGVHYKGAYLNGLVLRNVIPTPNPTERAPTRRQRAAAAAAAPAPAPATAAGSTFSIQTTSGSTLRSGFSSFDAAERAAPGFLSGTRKTVNIVEVPVVPSSRVVGTVGITANRR